MEFSIHDLPQLCRRATIGLDARGSIRPLAPAATAHFGTALDGRGAASQWGGPDPDVMTMGVGMR